MSEQSSFASRSHEPKVYIAPPAVRIAQARLRHELARYQQWRERLPLKERFDELLWSPQGMRFIRPHKPGDPEWVRQKLFWQRTYGDGHRNDRAGLQQQALETCKCIIYAPLRLAKNRADNRKSRCGCTWGESSMARRKHARYSWALASAQGPRCSTAYESCFFS